jgi:hypothetical protein
VERKWLLFRTSSDPEYTNVDVRSWKKRNTEVKEMRGIHTRKDKKNGRQKE